MAHLMKRRGLSDVVTTVLIILLVLAAVAMVWGYLQGALKSGGKQILDATSCSTLDLAPLSCKYVVVAGNPATYTTSVTYGRNAGEGNLVNATLIFELADGSSKVMTATAPKALETLANATTLWATAPKTFNVAGTVKGESGDLNDCPKSLAPVTCTL